jgi:predicted AAA+ superfamily ATPase
MADTKTVKTNLRRIVQEWQEFTLPAMHRREFPGGNLDKRRLLAIIGPRRSGKTWLCYQLMEDLLKKNVPRGNLLYVNFEDERLFPVTGQELTLLLDAYEEQADIHSGFPQYLFLDEIQNIPYWSKWVRRIHEQRRDVTIILTGSSSKLLSTEIATELRGRGESYTVFPYSFREYIASQGTLPEPGEKLLYSPEKNRIKKAFNQYFQRGGFPEARDCADLNVLLQGYYRTMFAQDMIERFSIKNVRLFEDYLKIQVSRFAALSSISRLEKELAALGHHFSKNTINAYLGHAKDILLLFEAPIYSAKVKNQLLYPRKIYAVDHGLLNAIRFSATADQGRLLENLVYMELKRRTGEVYYHADKKECDFVVKTGESVSQAIQVCWSLSGKDTLGREVDGLVEAMDAFKLHQGTILTEDETDDFIHHGKKIRVRPAWHFALFQ